MNTPTCPACAGSAVEATRFDGIYRCRQHGALEWFDRGRLADVDLLAIYQSYPYNASLQKDFHAMRALYQRGLRRRIRRYFPAMENLSFLDVGCANGEYLECAREAGMTPVAGVEVDAEAARKAARFGAVHRDMRELGAAFDVVQCKNVLSNIEDFPDFLAQLLRLTRPGGILFLDVLNQFGLVARAKKMLGRPGILRPPCVINGFSKPALRALVEKHGATVRWLGTTYCGSDLLPYRRSIGLSLRGRLSQLLGQATMIVADVSPAS